MRAGVGAGMQGRGWGLGGNLVKDKLWPLDWGRLASGASGSWGSLGLGREQRLHFLCLHPQHTQILTRDLVQHQVQAAAKGGIETHGHRHRHVAEGLGQAAAVDIILCQDIWGPGLGRG